MLVNAAQADRPGRGWWRNIIDLYGAADILVAEVQFQRLYPGGPGARALHRLPRPGQADRRRLHHLRTCRRRACLQMMREGVQRMDELFADALADGQARARSELDIPEPPPPPEVVEEAPQQVQARTVDAIRCRSSRPT